MQRSSFNDVRPLLSFALSFVFVTGLSAQISTIPDSMSQTGLGGINSIVGTVFGPSGKPVSTRVRVKLSTMASGDRITNTNETGNFAFRGLPAGSFTISVDKEKDFEPVSYNVDIIQFRGAPAVIQTLNIRLQPRGHKGTPPAVIDATLVNVPPEARAMYDKAIELGKTGDHKGAIELLEQAIALHPAFMFAHNEMGVQYLRINDAARADASFKEALKIAPAAFQPLMNRGMLLVQTKRFAEAVPLIQAALKAQEQSPVAHYFLGQALANLGDFDEAEKELVRAVKSGDPVVKEAYRTLAIIYSSKGNKKAAAEQLETYLKLTPQAPDAEQLRKVIAQLKGEPAPSNEKKPNK